MFSPDDRLIFAYCDRQDGACVDRSGDPYEILEALAGALRGRHPFDVWEQVRKPLVRPDDLEEGAAWEPDAATLADAREAEADLLPAIHAAFGTRPYDGAARSGLLRAEAFALFLDWVLFLLDLKKNTGTTPSSPPATGSAAS